MAMLDEQGQFNSMSLPGSFDRKAIGRPVSGFGSISGLPKLVVTVMSKSMALRLQDHPWIRAFVGHA